jgi:transposase InsO family protein
MCQLMEVSLAAYYRSLAEKEPEEEEMAVRDAIQRIALSTHRRLGILRTTKLLRVQEGMIVNHKRVERIMREDNLLAIRRRKFVLTTDSCHDLEVHVNLARRMQVTGINQLWVTDITYIRLRSEFVYLAIVLGRFSRKVIGWSLGPALTAKLAVDALEMAIGQRQPPPGVVIHSDRGVQYASAEFSRLVRACEMTPSMSRPGNPYDNAFCESFMKTLKQEEIYCTEYKDVADLRAHVEEFVEGYYNKHRLHSGIGYTSPEEFERNLALQGGGDRVGTATMPYYFQKLSGKDESAIPG